MFTFNRTDGSKIGNIIYVLVLIVACCKLLIDEKTILLAPIFLTLVASEVFFKRTSMSDSEFRFKRFKTRLLVTISFVIVVCVSLYFSNSADVKEFNYWVISKEAFFLGALVMVFLITSLKERGRS